MYHDVTQDAHDVPIARIYHIRIWSLRGCRTRPKPYASITRIHMVHVDLQHRIIHFSGRTIKRIKRDASVVVHVHLIIGL